MDLKVYKLDRGPEGLIFLLYLSRKHVLSLSKQPLYADRFPQK